MTHDFFVMLLSPWERGEVIEHGAIAGYLRRMMLE
jgi:hypothetical protein